MQCGRLLNVFLEKQKEKRRINQNSRDELLLFDDALSTYAAYAGPQEGLKIGEGVVIRWA